MAISNLDSLKNYVSISSSHMFLYRIIHFKIRFKPYKLMSELFEDQGPGLQYHLKAKIYLKLRISLNLSKSVLQCLPKDRKTLT